jgi:hypothetical protein
MGSVGIGTKTPAAKLHIAGNLKIDDGTQGAGKVLTTDANGLASWKAITETDPKITSIISNKIPKWDGTKLVDGLITDNGTNIGIGIVPTKKLDISGAGGLRVSTTNNGTGTADWIAGNFGASAGARVVMGNIHGIATIGSHTNDLAAWADLGINPDPTTKVGIGTLNPANKLTVSGNMDVTGNLGVGTNNPYNKMEVSGVGGLKVSTTNNGVGATDWIAGNFGAAAGSRVVMGSINSTATLGANNYDLSTWSDLIINPVYTARVGIGTINPLKKVDIVGIGGLKVSSTYTGSGDNADWIAGNFGGIGIIAFGDRVVMGNLGARATIGAHNESLSSWAPLAINPGGGNVGIGKSTPENTLDVNGSAGFGIINTTTSLTLNTAHHTLIIDPTNSAVTITLPAPNQASNRVYIIVNRDDANHSISGYRPIITTPAETPSTIIPAGSSITLQSNTNYWYQIR